MSHIYKFRSHASNPNPNSNPCSASKCAEMTNNLYMRLSLCSILEDMRAKFRENMVTVSDLWTSGQFDTTRPKVCMNDQRLMGLCAWVMCIVIRKT